MFSDRGDLVFMFLESVREQQWANVSPIRRSGGCGRLSPRLPSSPRRREWLEAASPDRVGGSQPTSTQKTLGRCAPAAMFSDTREKLGRPLVRYVTAVEVLNFWLEARKENRL